MRIFHHDILEFDNKGRVKKSNFTSHWSNNVYSMLSG